jgi:hypothetical protein
VQNQEESYSEWRKESEILSLLIEKQNATAVDGNFSIG